MQGDSYHGNVTNKLDRIQFWSQQVAHTMNCNSWLHVFLEWVAHDYTDLWISRLYILKLQHDHTSSINHDIVIEWSMSYRPDEI